jgi:hypothetical protein
MKHVGKMKNNAARVVVAYRTLPGDPMSALVVGTQGLGDSYHDTLMDIVQSEAGQQANELADILAARRFPDGSNMLGYLHDRGHLKKVATTLVLMTPDTKTQIQLDDLNKLIAEQKGIDVDNLAVSDTKTKATQAAAQVTAQAAKKAEAVKASKTPDFELTPVEMRSRADALYKEAARLRKEADALDPPKSKVKKATAGAE